MARQHEIRAVGKNTFCVCFPALTIPFYRLADGTAVLLDAGYARNGEVLLKLLEAEGLRVRAVLHSHLHVDHIAGDLALLAPEAVQRFGEPAFFGSRAELASFLGFFRAAPEKQTDPDTLRALTELEPRLRDIDGLAEVGIGGATFRIIETPGHSYRHKLLVTPDDICYLGDSVMYAGTLGYARTPYAADLPGDLKSKALIRSLPYPLYIAAHEGVFPKEELAEVVDRNLAINARILRAAAAVLDDAGPEADEEKLAREVLLELGVRSHLDTHWVRSTLLQYFEMYRETHRAEL